MKKLILSFALFALCTVVLQGQNNSTKKADNYYKKLQYIDAIKAYNKLVEDKKDDDYVHLQLATAYRYTSNSIESEKWYALAIKKNADPENYFWYAQMLASNGKYTEYKNAMQKFSSLKPTDSRAISFLKNPNFLQELNKQAPGFSIKSAELNSKYSDFGAYLSQNRIYFASARNTSGKTYGWNEEPTLDVFSASVTNGIFTDIKAVEGDINTKFNEGTLAISTDGKYMYFTRTNYFNGNYNKDREGVSNLKIFVAELNGDKWGNIKDVPFNSDNYSTGHPALSIDNKTLYFASNMPGGYGGTDIYKVSINNGAFGKPENMGSVINTPNDEQFPFVDAEGTLYFSSNGHPSLGGMDIFSAKWSNNNFNTVTNIGKPVNSNKDDFSFTFNTVTGTGFIASNREGGSGSDDIYTISRIVVQSQPELPREEVVTKEITDEKVTLLPIYFELGKSNITADSAAELDKLVAVMRKFPNMIIMVNAYADNNGSAEFNMLLTEKRAQAAVDYISLKNIGKERLSAHGYGKSQPAVVCNPCTEEQNALNRRSEFVIVKK